MNFEIALEFYTPRPAGEKERLNENETKSKKKVEELEKLIFNYKQEERKKVEAIIQNFKIFEGHINKKFWNKRFE